jgi:hypothetical protein
MTGLRTSPRLGFGSQKRADCCADSPPDCFVYTLSELVKKSNAAGGVRRRSQQAGDFSHALSSGATSGDRA